MKASTFLVNLNRTLSKHMKRSAPARFENCIDIINARNTADSLDQNQLGIEIEAARLTTLCAAHIRAPLAALGALEPAMPPFDESKFKRMPEVEIDPRDEY